MRRSPTLGLVLWALAVASACTGRNPLFELTVTPSIDAGGDTSPVDDRDASAGEADGGTGDAPIDQADAAGSADEDGRIADSNTGTFVDAAGDRGPVDVAPGNDLDGSSLNPDAPPGDAAGSDAPATGVGTLIGYWRFDDGPMASTVSDASGYGHHGVVEGLDVSTAWVAGRVGGYALEFPPRGTNDPSGVRIPVTPVIDNMRAFTVAAWIKRDINNGTNYWTIISRQIAGSDDEIFNLACDQTDLLVYVPRSILGVLGEARGPGAAPDDTWIHAAATYDGIVLRLYANGGEVGSGTYPNRLRSSTTPVYIGTNKNTVITEPFEGIIDDVVLYSRALPASAIASLAAGGSPYTFR